MLDIPDSTVMTPSREAAKRMAQEAGEASGSASRMRALTSLGGSASLPPFTGSMTTIGLLCLRATS